MNSSKRNNWMNGTMTDFLLFCWTVRSAHKTHTQLITNGTHLMAIRERRVKGGLSMATDLKHSYTHLLNCLAQSCINCNSFRSIDSTSVTRADTSLRSWLFSSSKSTTLSCRQSQLSNSDVLSFSRYPPWDVEYELLIEWSEVSHNEASSFDSRSAL